MNRIQQPANKVSRSRLKRFFGEEAGQPYRYAYRMGRYGMTPVLCGRVTNKTETLFWSSYQDGLKHRYNIISRVLHNIDTFLLILSDKGPSGLMRAARMIYNHNKYPYCKLQ
jgi:hypothetical protein